jgi:hypothetical protein
MQVFTDNADTTALGLMLKGHVPVTETLDFIKAQKLMEVEKLSKAGSKIAQVAEKATHDRKAAIQRQNYKTHVLSPSFQVGDYVLLVAEHLFCRPDQFSRSSYVDDNSCLISE